MVKVKDAKGKGTTTEIEQAADDWAKSLGSLKPKEKKDEKAPQSAANDELANTVKSLQSQLEELRLANIALLSQPQTAAPPVQTQEAFKLDLSGLPSPVEDPEAYGKALNDRISAGIAKGIESATAGQRAETDRRRSAENTEEMLYDRFEALYPDYAKHEGATRLAVDTVLKNAAMRGMNVQTYITRTTDMFLGDVKKEMDSAFGAVLKLGEKPAEQTEDDDDGEPSGRTAGMFGPSGGKAPDEDEDKPEEPKGLVGDMIAIQKQMGI